MSQNTSKQKSDASFQAARQTLGRNVARLRKQAGLSQEQLALQINADQAYISRIEAAQLNPTLKTITELADTLGSDVQTLLADT